MRPPRRLLLLALTMPASVACQGSAAPHVDASPAPPAASAVAEASPRAGQPCGALDCRLFDAPEDAFAVVLAQRPRALGIGEAHAQKGMDGVDSSTKRFTERLLPLLRDRASDLLVELMLPPTGCKKAEKKVRAKQQEVVERQAETNQSEYVTMGEAARRLGLVADALRPSCEDLAVIAQAGDLAVPRMLETIARLAAAKAKELLGRREKAGVDKMVVLYGGALHNVAAPKPDRAAWSFGPELLRATGGRYVELSMFVPESIQDSDSWRALAWVPHYDRAAHGAKTALFRTGPSSWALIFPASPRP